jgi:hypothetical protein
VLPSPRSYQLVRTCCRWYFFIRRIICAGTTKSQNAPGKLARQTHLDTRRPKTLTDICKSRAPLVSLRAISGPRSRPVATTIIKAAKIAFATFSFLPRQEVHLLHPPTNRTQGLSTQFSCFPTPAIAAQFRPPRQNFKNFPTLAQRSRQPVAPSVTPPRQLKQQGQDLQLEIELAARAIWLKRLRKPS